MVNILYNNVVRNTPYFIVIIFISSLFYFNYQPTWDESFQIEAANRLLINNSYDSSWVLPTDLSKPTFKYLTAWPIGYSFLIYICLALGFNIKFSLIFIKILFIGLNLLIWSKASANFLINRRSKLFFKIIFSFVLIVDSISTTEIVLMSIFGGITCLVFNENLPKIKLYLYLGILLSIAFIFKYTAVVLIFSTLVYLIFELNEIKNYKYILLKFLPPIIIVVVTIFYFNYINSNNVSTLTNFNSLSKFYFIKNISLFQLTTTVFLKSIQIPILVKKGLLYYYNYVLSNYAITVFVIPLFFVVTKKVMVKNLKYIIVVFLSAIFLLLVISTLFFTNPDKWYPLIEPRYYVPFSPLLLIFYSHVITFYDKNVYLNKLIFCGTILIIFSCLGIYISKKNKYSGRIESNLSNIERFINRSSLNVNKVVFLDKFYFPLLIRNGKFNSFYFQDYYDRISLNVTNDIYVYVVASKNNLFSKNYYEKEVELKNIIAFTRRNNFNRTDISTDVIIFWKGLKK